MTDDEVLSMWDQAGERPFELIVEYGLDSRLLAMLTENISDTLWRGSPRNHYLKVGDTKIFDYPSSWSASKEVAERFIDGCDHKVILVVNSSVQKLGIHNSQNSYEELEVILAPITLTVSKILTKKDITYVHLS